MKFLLQLVCMLTLFGVNHALFCAQRVMTIAETQLKNEITQEAYNLYTIQTPSNESNAINTITSNTWPSSDTLSAQTSESHTGVPTVVLTQDFSQRKPLYCLSLRASKQPNSAPVSQRSSPVLKPHILKSQSQSAPASTESSPISNTRQINSQINSSPSIRPVTPTSTQTESMTRIALPQIILTVSAQTGESKTAQKKTLQRTTSFSPSSSSMSSTSAPVTTTKQEESIYFSEEDLCALERSSSFLEIPYL